MIEFYIIYVLLIFLIIALILIFVFDIGLSFTRMKDWYYIRKMRSSNRRYERRASRGWRFLDYYFFFKHYHRRIKKIYYWLKSKFNISLALSWKAKYNYYIKVSCIVHNERERISELYIGIK